MACRMILALMVSLCLWAAHAHPASTTETIVVTRAENTVRTTTSTPTETPSTEGPQPAVKLTQMDVTSEVALRYAHTAVVTRVRNPARRAQETTFHVLLPETAFISGFTMILDGKSYKAYVKDKEEAKNIYNAAVSQGIGTALVSAKARDSNHFTVSVNVEPNTEAVFNLTYEELLERRNGVYNHAINLHPGALVPRLTVRVHIKETQRITTLRVPELRSGNEIDANENDAPNTNAVITRDQDGREATVTFSPDLDEQRRLMTVYVNKTRSSYRSASSRFRSAEHDNAQDPVVLGQFVVQYDVDRANVGEILVNNDYFVHFFAPNLPPLPKHVVFVLDTSYSMKGHKIEQLKEAMDSILSELSPDDFFNIVEFRSNVMVHDLSEADLTPSHNFLYHDSNNRVALKCPSAATSSNVEKAKTIIRRLRVGGATNIYKALDTAIDIVNRGINPANGACTIGQTTNELSSTPADSEGQRPEPIVIFLTDGMPVVGVTDTQRIISHITERNTGANKAAIFSLAFGEDADRTFLRKLSLRNEGFMRHIYEAADAALQLRDFYRQVASPLLSNVRFTYPPEQVKEDTLTTHALYSFYKGGEVVVAGQLVDGQLVDFEPTIEGFGFIDSSKQKKMYRVQQRASAGVGDLPLERLWAYLTVKQLLDKRDAADTVEDINTLKQRALSIALRYEFVTPLTSLVVVKPNATSAVDPESVDKPGYGALMPSGSSNVHAFGQIQRPTFIPAAYRPSYSYPPQSYGALSGSHRSFIAQSSHSYPLRADSGLPMLTPQNIYPSSWSGPGGLRGMQQNYFSPMSFNRADITAGLQTSSSTTPAPTTSSTSSPLAAYRLEEYPWARDLIDAPSDTLRLRLGNGTEVSLKLAKNAEDEPAGAGEECAPSTAGGAGACTYLGRCVAARALTADAYLRLYCSRDGYAGVCCPKVTNTSLPQATETS